MSKGAGYVCVCKWGEAGGGEYVWGDGYVKERVGMFGGIGFVRHGYVQVWICRGGMSRGGEYSKSHGIPTCRWY